MFLLCYNFVVALYSITIFLLTFIFGVCIGSFLNVVIYRMGSGTSLRGRSKCFSCGKQLTALMLIPLLSYFVMRGRCGYCGSKISPQYPLIEIATGLLFALTAYKTHLLSFSLSNTDLLITALEAGIWAVLVVVFVYDWKHKIIPDKLSLLFAVLSGVLLYIKYIYGMSPFPYIPFLESVPKWIDWAGAPAVAVPLALVWLATLGRGMGLGDAKLAWGIGWFLGFSGGITAVILSFWIAFFPSLVLLFLKKNHFTMKSEIPFAPFLILGTFVTYTFGVNILTWVF